MAAHILRSKRLIQCVARLGQNTQSLRSCSVIVKKGTSVQSFTPGSGTHKGHDSRLSNPNQPGFQTNKQHYEDNTQHSNTFTSLLAALGTVVVLGLGTVFAKACEGSKGDSDRTHKLDSSSCVPHAQEGEDVVGTENKSKPNKCKCGNTQKTDTSNCIAQDENIVEREMKQRTDKATLTTQSQDPHSAPLKSTNIGSNNHEEKVRKARQLMRRYMEEVGAPGMVVGVTINGKQAWEEGLGFADVENGVRCQTATVMRIASISKALTMTIVAKLWEDGKIDLDDPIQKYIPTFPVKTYEGQEVKITTRQLISHKSGIRHYKLKNDKENGSKKKENEHIERQTKEDEVNNKENEHSNEKTEIKQTDSHPTNRDIISIGTDLENDNEASNKIENNEIDNKKERGTKKCACGKHMRKRNKKKKKKEDDDDDDDEFDLKEYYIKEEFETIQEALSLFQNDELFFKPGEDFLYTTHGWTVVSAVLEGATQEPFTELVRRLFFELGLHSTYLDRATPIIYNRASYYIRDKNGRLKNAPYVDNSYKWAGGGFLSTVGDLCKFGNAMLYASQQPDHPDGVASVPGYLKTSTIQHLWTPVEGTQKAWQDRAYGMGWEAVRDHTTYKFCRESRRHAYHTGGAVGASSILLVVPQRDATPSAAPQGVVVALLTNMQGVGLHSLAMKIATLFEDSER